jgi:hypothetical protein
MTVLKITLVSFLLFIQSAYCQPIAYQAGHKLGHPLMRHLPQRPHFFTLGSRLKTRGQRVSLSRKLPYIDSVFVRGDINLQVTGSRGENRIQLKAYYPELTIRVYRGAIYISYSKPLGYPQNLRPHPSIKLSLNRLRRLTISGEAHVVGGNLNTDYGLTITNCGSGFLLLSGPLNIVKVENTGRAVVDLKGVMSQRLYILATRQGVIKLTGTAHLLLIRAFQQAIVDTRFMDSDTAFVQAGDDALVTVCTYGSLRAFATDMSNIYYYTPPAHLIKHSALSGNILPMR